MKLFEQLMKGKFYGELRIKFNAGHIVHIEKNESLDVKPFATETTMT